MVRSVEDCLSRLYFVIMSLELVWALLVGRYFDRTEIVAHQSIRHQNLGASLVSEPLEDIRPEMALPNRVHMVLRVVVHR